MELKTIFELQRKLDQAILDKHQVDSQDVAKKRILAFLVELGELGNESACFKYWKIQKKINREKLVEEYVDGIHFLVSFGLIYDSKTCFKAQIVHYDLSQQFLELFAKIVALNHNINKEAIEEIFEFYLGLAVLLNVSEKDIYTHYVLKNKINYQRLDNNY